MSELKSIGFALRKADSGAFSDGSVQEAISRLSDMDIEVVDFDEKGVTILVPKMWLLSNNPSDIAGVTVAILNVKQWIVSVFPQGVPSSYQESKITKLQGTLKTLDPEDLVWLMQETAFLVIELPVASGNVLQMLQTYFEPAKAQLQPGRKRGREYVDDPFSPTRDKPVEKQRRTALPTPPTTPVDTSYLMDRAKLVADQAPFPPLPPPAPVLPSAYPSLSPELAELNRRFQHLRIETQLPSQETPSPSPMDLPVPPPTPKTPVFYRGPAEMSTATQTSLTPSTPSRPMVPTTEPTTGAPVVLNVNVSAEFERYIAHILRNVTRKSRCTQKSKRKSRPRKSKSKSKPKSKSKSKNKPKSGRGRSKRRY